MIACKRLFETLIIWLIAVLPLSAQIELTAVANLPDQVQESSGLLYIEGVLYTHNDSGGAAELYALDPNNGALLRTIRVNGANHVDWEDIAQDNTYIYIGDFGNNLGRRTDLTIYRILKADMLTDNEVNAESIEFVLEDQTNFDPPENHPYDMEAFFVQGDRLVILTKDRQEFSSTAYSLPSTPGNHIAERLDTGDVLGLVTGADYDVAGDRLYILGYTSLARPFLVQVDQPAPEAIFQSGLIRETIEIGFAQSEGIAFAGGDTIYITTERLESNPFGASPARLYRGVVDLGADTPPDEPEPGDDDPPTGDTEDALILYQPLGSSALHFRLTTDQAVFGRGIYNSAGVRVSYTPLELLDEAPIPIDHLSPGVYFLAYYLSRDIVVKAFQVP